jgi:serpin B
MQRRDWLLIFSIASLVACEGTSTGNPMDVSSGPDSGTDPDSGSPPEGVTVFKSTRPYDSSPEVSENDAALLGEGNRAFAFDLYRQLPRDGNLFVSPFSISVALGMTLPGAEGTTESEMRSALHFDLPEPALHSAFNGALLALAGRANELAEDSSGTGFELSIVNQAWGQDGYPFQEPYLDVLAEHYGAGLFGVNFADSDDTRQLINGWVEDQTGTRIKDLLPADAITVDTRLVLTNAIYFKASWLSKFDPDDTADGTFQAPGGERTVPMMVQDELDAQYVDGDGYQAIELPYVSKAVRMLFILPDEGEFETVSSTIDDAFFQGALAGLTEHVTTVSIPKFEFESENPLKGPLRELGMPTAFSGSADFTAIAGGVEQLFIDEVYHKAFIALNEEGVEAAAATAVVISTESSKPVATITFDRPFLFAIYDEPTGQILFLGHVLDPS